MRKRIESNILTQRTLSSLAALRIRILGIGYNVESFILIESYEFRIHMGKQVSRLRLKITYVIIRKSIIGMTNFFLKIETLYHQPDRSQGILSLANNNTVPNSLKKKT